MPEATVRIEQGAIHVTDTDPDDRMLVVNAYNVLEHCAELLGSPGVTLRESKFAANELMRSLRDVLDLFAPWD